MNFQRNKPRLSRVFNIHKGRYSLHRIPKSYNYIYLHMNEKCTVHCIHVDLIYLFNCVIFNDMNNQIKINLN